jgi:hypothetical protein
MRRYRSLKRRPKREFLRLRVRFDSDDEDEHIVGGCDVGFDDQKSGTGNEGR